jgi:hypothetical protein
VLANVGEGTAEVTTSPRRHPTCTGLATVDTAGACLVAGWKGKGGPEDATDG